MNPLPEPSPVAQSVQERGDHCVSTNADRVPIRYEPPKPDLSYMGRFHVDLCAPIWELGATSDAGTRRIVPITGGSVSGPLLNGEILNNGADWQLVSKDGVTMIDTRYLLKMDDGEYVYLRTRGMRHGPDDVMDDVIQGKPVNPSLYYFRLYLDFETSSARYGWLSRAMAVGYAMRLGDAVVYDAYLLS